MRFFTFEWWMGQQTGTPASPTEAYERHFKAIEDKVPRELAELELNGDLHDAKLRVLHSDSRAQTLELDLAAIGANGSTVHVRLRYLGVVSLHETGDPECGLPGPFGFGDLGYTEVDVVDGDLVHSLLFSSGIELQVRFKSFEKRTWTPRSS